MIYLVALSGGYLVNLEEGFRIYEVDRSLVFPVQKHLGVHELQNCRTLVDVRNAVAENENRVRAVIHADDWPELFDELAYRSDKYAWDNRNPEATLALDEEGKPEAVIWLDGR